MGGALPGAETLPSSYFPALGAAIEPFYEKGIHINLLPAQFIEKQKSRQKQQSFITLGALIIAAITLGVVYLHSYRSVQEKLTRWYEKQNKRLAPMVEQLDDMQKKTRIISSYVRDPRNALAILDKISTFGYMPKKVTIMEFKYEKGVSVEISGYALSIKDLNTFIADLEKSAFFRRVDIKQRNWQQLPNNRKPKVLNYTLICLF